MQRSAVPSGLRCRRRANPAAAPCSAAQCPPSCAAGHRPKLLPCGEVQRSAVPSELRCRHRTKPNAGWLTTVHHSSVCTADSTLTTLSRGAAQRSILWAALPAPVRAAPWCVDPPRVVSPYAGTDTWDGTAPPDAVRVCRGMETINDNHQVGSPPHQDPKWGLRKEGLTRVRLSGPYTLVITLAQVISRKLCRGRTSTCVNLTRVVSHMLAQRATCRTCTTTTTTTMSDSSSLTILSSGSIPGLTLTPTRLLS